MESDPKNLHRGFWRIKANQVRLRVNTGWWLETLSAPLVVTSVIGTAGLLWVRQELAADPRLLYAAVGGCLALLGLACLARAARKFETTGQSMVRIEAAMRSEKRPFRGERGSRRMAGASRQIDAGLSWQWPRLLVPVLARWHCSPRVCGFR